MSKKYIVANWKMNPLEVREATKLFNEVKKKIPKLKKTKVIICPPFVYLGELSLLYSGNKISFGAQDSFWENKGSFTGEISPIQIKDLGGEYVILGHSERRAQGETNEIVNKKIKACLSSGLKVILCIGEKDRDEGSGEHLHFIKEEIKESLKGVNKNHLGRIIIAYEPIWAIGKSQKDAMTPETLHQMKLFILKILKDMYGTRGMDVSVIYGGSVEPENTEELIKDGEVDGLLVGHKSLIAKEFLEIIRIADLIK